MPRLPIVGVVWIMAAMVLPVRATERVQAPRAIAVRVIDLVGAPLRIRRRALEQAARLFERVDVTIVWDNSNRLTSVPSKPFVVDVTLLDHGNDPLTAGSVLGSATLLPSVPAISVFYRDVQELAQTYGVPSESPLRLCDRARTGPSAARPARPYGPRTDAARLDSGRCR